LIEDSGVLGTIVKNSHYGIYGTLNDAALDKFPNVKYPIALRNDIKVGPATILANIDGKKLKNTVLKLKKFQEKAPMV